MSLAREVDRYFVSKPTRNQVLLTLGNLRQKQAMTGNIKHRQATQGNARQYSWRYANEIKVGRSEVRDMFNFGILKRNMKAVQESF